jgi:PAS domain S-box-containing protein
LRGILDAAADAILIVDEQGRIVRVNARAEEWFGYREEEILGQPVEQLVPKRVREAHLAHREHYLAAPRVRSMGEGMDLHARRRDGSEFPADISLSPLESNGARYVIVVVRDVTVRRQAEQALAETRELLHQVQKMEALGHLAAGVAHDFNNLLTPIRGFAELLREAGLGERQRWQLEQIIVAAQTAAAVAGQLLTFSRQQPVQSEILDLNGVLGLMGPLLQRLIGERITLSMRLATGPAWVLADRGQIEQIILNLAVNARDAIPGRGRVVVETAIGATTRGAGDRRPFVLLAVRDTGVGMDLETQRRIFEPFFTTRERPKGTGLGLATVHGAVMKMSGHIEVESAPGQGTTFRLFFPLAQQPERTAAVGDTSQVGGSETVLLVDDQPSVRALAAEVLTMNGYQVLQADCATEAIAIAGSYRGPIDLLLTDLVLPDASGRELALMLRRARSEMRVLYMSGYPGDAVPPGAGEGGHPRLQKPFTPVSLTQKVRASLDSEAGQRPPRVEPEQRS